MQTITAKRRLYTEVMKNLEFKLVQTTINQFTILFHEQVFDLQ